MGESVFLGTPTYGDQLHAETAAATYLTASRTRHVITSRANASLINLNCNSLWATALNLRKEHGLKWFAMLHADVVPDPYWLDTLIDEADAYGADMMSAVVAIKGPQGLTSTALVYSRDPWNPTRLTLKQINDPEFPETFDGSVPAKVYGRGYPPPRLLVNTGCCVIRIDREWAEGVAFETRDRIVKREGAFVAETQSEDWGLSLQIANVGGTVFATKKVRTIHKGSGDYDSRGTWGLDRDPNLKAN